MGKRIARTALAVFCLLAMLFSDAAPVLVRYAGADDDDGVTQDDIDKKKKEKSELEKQKAELQSQLKELQRSKKDALAQKENLDTQISIIRSEIANTEEQIGQYQALIEQTEGEIADTQRRHVDQYDLFCARVRAMEERGTVTYWSVLFHSSSFADLLASIDF
ncbi:MAG: peptidase M23, partial [Oscillospiraceae bacterium]|nr:peptidase M23 [Oscillospiraceae bacterium]